MNPLSPNMFWSQPNGAGQIPVPELSPNPSNIHPNQPMYYMMPPQHPQFPPQVMQTGVPIPHQGPGPPLFHPHQQLMGFQQQQRYALFKPQQPQQQPAQTSPQQIVRQQNHQWTGYGQPFVKTEQVPIISPNSSAIVFDNGTPYLIDTSAAGFGPFHNWAAPNFFQFTENNGVAPNVLVTKPTKSEAPKVSPNQLTKSITGNVGGNVCIKREDGGPLTKVEPQLQQHNVLVKKETNPIGVHVKEELKIIPSNIQIAIEPNIQNIETIKKNESINNIQVPLPNVNDEKKNENKESVEENDNIAVENEQGDTNKPFVCTFCKFAASSKFSLGRHVRGVHEKKKDFKCPSCDYAAAQKGTLDGHINAVHYKIKPFQCTQCDHATSHKFRLDNHIKSKHSFKCNMCNFVDLKKENWENHVKTCHQFKCEKCDFVSSQKTSMDEHIKTHSSEQEKGMIGKNSVQTFILQPRNGNSGQSKANDDMKLVSLPIVHCSNPSPSISSIQTINKNDSNETETIITVCDVPANDDLKIKNNMSIIQLSTPDDKSQQDSQQMYEIKLPTSLQKESIPSLTLPKPSISSILVSALQPSNPPATIASNSMTIENLTTGRNSIAVPMASPYSITDDTNSWQDENNSEMDVAESIDRPSTVDQVPTSTTEAGGKRKRYKCEKCEFSTRQSYSLRRHVRFVHDKIRPFKCAQCTFAAAQKSDLDKHIIVIHENGKYLKCKLCSYNAKRKQLLDEHIINIHGVIAERNESVEDNGKVSEPLVQHNIISSENEISTTSNDAMNPLSPSQDIVGDRGESEEHPSIMENIQIAGYDNGNISLEQGKDKNRQIKCEKCDYSTNQKYLLQRHVKFVHDKIRPFKCTKCEMSFGQKAHLSSHHRSIHDKLRPFNCDYCPHSASEKGNLDKHIRAVHAHLIKDVGEDVSKKKEGDNVSVEDITHSNTQNVQQNTAPLKQENGYGYITSTNNVDVQSIPVSSNVEITKLNCNSQTTMNHSNSVTPIQNITDLVAHTVSDSQETGNPMEGYTTYEISYDLENAPSDDAIQNIILDFEEENSQHGAGMIIGNQNNDGPTQVFANSNTSGETRTQNVHNGWKIKSEFQSNPYLGILEDLQDIKPTMISSTNYLYNPTTMTIQQSQQSYDNELCGDFGNDDLASAIASILPIEQNGNDDNYITNSYQILSADDFSASPDITSVTTLQPPQ